MSNLESSGPAAVPKSGKKQSITFWNVLGASFFAALIFVAGWGIGSGRITLNTVKDLNSDVTDKPDYSKINQAYRLLKKNYDGKLTQQQLTDGILTGLANAPGDPYTEYFNAKDAKGFNEQIDGTIVGIGAQLSKSSDGHIEIVAPLEGSPAAEAGLRTKDIIAKVGNDSTAGWPIEKAVTKIRGDIGTPVTLTIVRSGGSPFAVKITRAEIDVPSVESSIIDGNIGYMQVSQFSKNTASLAKSAALKFKKAGVDSVVLDLRNNGGGLVTAAQSVASLWLPKNKLIMQEKRSGTTINSIYATGDNPLLGLKTIVLVNGGTASASEIVTGALKDNNTATTIGEKTYGKGVVQSLLNLSGGAELKVTIASWYRPNGQNINKKGITPDKTVKMTANDYKSGQDRQRDAAIKQLQ